MNRKIFFLMSVAVIFTFILSTCGSDNYDVPVEGVELNRTTASLEVNGTLTLSAAVMPVEAFNKIVKWTSSNTAIATVAAIDTVCTVTAISPGEVAIIVTTEEGGFTRTCNVTVTQSVAGITLNKTTLSLVEGTSETLIATVTPSNASNKKVVWKSSDNTVATVDSDGKVFALKASPTAVIITATTEDGTKSATCNLTVTAAEVLVGGVTLNVDKLTLKQDSTAILVANVWPPNATNKSVTWSSSNTSLATVGNDGTVKALLPGTVNITATSVQDASKSATCVVTVVVPVASVTLSHTKLTNVGTGLYRLTLDEQEVIVLQAIVNPANATIKTINWRSSDDSKVTVANDGTVTAKKATLPGEEISIIASSVDGGRTAICLVTVNSLNVPVTSVTISPDTVALQIGQSTTLTANILPLGATNKSVTWTSSVPTVASVTAAGGVVNALTAGTTIITVTTADGAKTDTCKVVVSAVPVTSVTLNKTTFSWQLSVNDDPEQLIATVLPANATNKDVTWTSSAPAVAKVSGNGIVTPLTAGTATITVTTVDGSKTATCNVTISP